MNQSLSFLFQHISNAFVQWLFCCFLAIRYQLFHFSIVEVSRGHALLTSRFFHRRGQGRHPEKKVAVLFDFVQITPPPPPKKNWTTCKTFFERQKRWFKCHSKWFIIQNSLQVKVEYLLCGSCIQPKKELKVQIIGILEEINFYFWPKMHLWKGDKKFGQGPPPLIWTKSKRTAAFFRTPSLS